MSNFWSAYQTNRVHIQLKLCKCCIVSRFIIIIPDFFTTDFTVEGFRKRLNIFNNSWIFIGSCVVLDIFLELFCKSICSFKTVIENNCCLNRKTSYRIRNTFSSRPWGMLTLQSPTYKPYWSNPNGKLCRRFKAAKCTFYRKNYSSTSPMPDGQKPIGILSTQYMSK